MRDTWITVDTSPTSIIGAGSGTNLIRAEAMLYNPGPTTVWVGNESINLGISRGFPLVSGAAASWTVINESLWARVLSGTQVIYPTITGVPT